MSRGRNQQNFSGLGNHCHPPELLLSEEQRNYFHLGTLLALYFYFFVILSKIKSSHTFIYVELLCALSPLFLSLSAFLLTAIAQKHATVIGV